MRFMDAPVWLRMRSSPLFAVGLGLVAVALYVLHQGLLDAATFAQTATNAHAARGRLVGPDFYLALPYPVLDAAFVPSTKIHVALLGVAVLETLVLYALYRTLRDRAARPLERAGLAAAAVVMLVLALTARTLIGFDLYAYLGYAMLPSVHAAYGPPGGRFPGTFGAINDVWGTPLVASYYGPLWTALSRIVASATSTLGSGLFGFRLIELLPFAAVTAALALRGGLVLAALFALDPAIQQLYVANGHNDLFGVALVFFAFVVAKRYPAAAAVLVGAAGLIKLPFAVSALLVFAGRDRLPQRIGWAALACALVVAGSLLFAGVEYVHDLAFRLNQVNDHHGGINELTGKAVKGGLMLVAAIALIAAFARAIVWRAAAWSFIALSSNVYPWYLGWSFPYAFLDRGGMAVFLIAFPLGAALLENAFPHLGLGQLAMLAMLIAAGYQIAGRKSRALDDQIIRPGP